MTVEAETTLDLVEIVEKASSLAERLSGAFVPASPVDPEAPADAEVEARLQHWCQNAARGDWEDFKKRLAWDGHRVESVRCVLGPVRLADGQPLPGWVHTLGQVLSRLPSPLPIDDSDRCLDDTAPVPFQDVWLPFVHLARRRLIASAGSAYELLSVDALAALERELLRTLATIGSRSLYVEFSAFQARRWPGRLLDLFQQADDQPAEKLSTDRYDQFVRYLLDGGLSDFFREYAVAARLTAVATDQWVESTADFLNRLAADLSDIQSCFAAGSDLGSVVDVTAGLSDPHHQGHSVLALRFASGLRLVYKPRDVGLEAAYNRLLAWLNDQAITPTFKVLQILKRSTHGWVEFVEHLPCQNADEAALYYRRAGMLLGLFYVLRGSDCHSGNLIACGPHPVVIDLEVLLNPVIAGDLQHESLDSIQPYRNSVLTIGLLPMWDRTPDGSAYDMSGLGGTPAGQSVRRPEWHHVNTDQMKLVKRTQVIQETSAVPYLNQTALSPTDYVAEIVTGFQQMVYFIRGQRAAFLAPGGPMSVFKHRRARFVFRNTSLYDQLREFAFAPRAMKEGTDHSIHFDLLCSALISADTKPIFWPLLNREVQALEQMDIPLFSMVTDENAVISDTDDVIVTNAFVDNGYDLAVHTLDQLSEADVALQSGFVRAAMVTKLAGGGHRRTSVDQPLRDPVALPLLTPAQLVEEAAAMADKLLRAAVRFGNGMTWISLDYAAELERYELKPVDHSLYSGTLGIALFLGALANATGDKSYHDQALAVLQDVRADLNRGDIRRAARLGNRLGLGSAYGIGAVVYALTRLGQFLDQDELASAARRAAALLTPEMIASDFSLDVFSGSAGAILGLLSLFEQSPDAYLLDQAVACGQHLLQTRATAASGCRAWVTLNDAFLTGFSHGAAGIAYALVRLYEKAPDPEFLNAAREAIAYESCVFSPQAGNWPDFRFPQSGAPVFTTTWCHGAPGIALARLGGLKWLDSEPVRSDIDAALETTRQALLTGREVDHLCCGTLGRIETLFKAGQVLSRRDLTEIAFQVSTSVIGSAERRGSYSLFASLPDGIDNPGFFQGTSGIGYQWLRLAYPDRFPSVLLWE